MSGTARTFLYRFFGRCPNCLRKAEDSESGYRCCQWCGWTDEPSCDHGILESEWCPSCPGGGV